jgi:hypothetical protein
MNFDLRFTDKKITAWGGMAILKRMLDHLGFDAALSAAYGETFLRAHNGAAAPHEAMCALTGNSSKC